MTPGELVAPGRLPLHHRRADARTRRSRCSSGSPRRAEREAELRRDGYPAYTTSVGWLGYDDDKIRRLCREALADGWTRFKMKVGADLDDDLRRGRIIRDEIGPDRDARGRRQPGLGRRQAIDWMPRLAPFDPYWIEEPTSPDDILGHAAIARAVAPDPRRHRRARPQPGHVQAVPPGRGDRRLPDRRLPPRRRQRGLAVLLLAAEFGVPVCPHAGGVGLCELVQHLSSFDYIAVSGALDGRMIEYVDHLHEHFVDPVVVRDGALPAADRRPATARRCSRVAGALPLSRRVGAWR